MTLVDVKIGDRVRVKQPKEGRPFHTLHGNSYTKECQPGFVGTVVRTRQAGGTACAVRWDGGQVLPRGNEATESVIDLSCLEAEDASELALDEEAARLFGIKQTPHCQTCTCHEEKP